jgi:phosphoribosylformylglycinamidine synthase
VKAAVIVFPGSNCDRDARVALTHATGRPPEMIWHAESELPALDLIVLPGGFAYGDYLRAGAMAAHSPVMREVVARARAGTPVLAICNGFQIAAEAGLLPGALVPNAGLKFVCRDVHLRVESSASVFTGRYQRGQVIRLPIAHHEGNYYADGDRLKALLDNDQVAFRYTTPEGEVRGEANPNGSADNIAGVFNETKTVLGLMPHPERLADARLGGSDGSAMFEALAAALA